MNSKIVGKEEKNGCELWLKSLFHSEEKGK